MFNNAKNGVAEIGGASMDYIRFGSGDKNLLMIPGVGDGIKTVKGMALPFSVIFGKLAKSFRVYVLSQRNDMPEGYTNRDMAKDVHCALDALGIEKAFVVGVSQGGMIAQYLAIDHPEKVERLVLTVTLAKPNETVREAISGWISMAKRGDFKGIMLDTAERSYTQKHLKRSRWMYALTGTLGKPKSFERFITMANACITHDAYEELENIVCPTLIIGGTEDKVLTGEASKEIHEKIAGSELYMYEGLSHGLYEEAKDYADRVTSFFE